MSLMLRYLAKRLAFMGLTVLAVCALTFFLMNIIPGGTAELILKHTILEMEEIPTDEQIAEISSRYNLHDPLYIQFGRWLSSALEGDLGSSYIQKKLSPGAKSAPAARNKLTDAVIDALDTDAPGAKDASTTARLKATGWRL